MPVTQQLSSKANVKKTTNQDLPFNPAQPVLGRYKAVSTLNQTVINLSFSTESANTDQVVIIVDGKILTPGLTEDYNWTNFGTDGTSSQVTLTSSLPANLNIQAIKFGSKIEKEFLSDARFTAMWAAMGQGFQGFISNEFQSVATATIGTPAAGTFYSTVVNRAPMMDLSQDLRVRNGTDRIPTAQIAQLPNEFGPNGEFVYSVVNDIYGRMRFVGSFAQFNDANGQFVGSSVVNDYVEITFYGTGIRALLMMDGNARDIRASVDGGAEGANIHITNSNVLASRKYSPNLPVMAVSGLSLGVHTLKLRVATGGLYISGFDVLNESANIIVNPGVSYMQGKKYVSTTQTSYAIATDVTGVRGGRMVVYQNADGSIGRAFRAVNAAQANLTAADHTNEEVSRVYHFREFGAGRTGTSPNSDDFSGNLISVAHRNFVLEDGTTSLLGINVRTDAVVSNAVGPTNGSGNGLTITFVGTGLDVELWNNGATRQYDAVLIDGQTSVGVLSKAGSSAAETRKIVSGLPYGTHTVSFQMSGSSIDAPGIAKFIVYQPKKPTVPAGTVELADYNVMATWAQMANIGVGNSYNIATGVLRKQASKEIIYVNGTGGTQDWFFGNTPIQAAQVGGFQIFTDRNGAYAQYTFTGTGFNFRGLATTNNSNNVSVTLNGTLATTANFPTMISSTTGFTFTASTGILNTLVGSDVTGASLNITGLPYGTYTVRLTNNTTNILRVEAFDIVTPIHAAKSNLIYDVQNTLPVGSQSISDSRVWTALKDVNTQSKNISQANKITQTVTNTATSFVPITDMSMIHFNRSGKIRIDFTGYFTTTASNPKFAIFIDGTSVGEIWATDIVATNHPVTFYYEANVSPGIHKIDIAWRQTTGTGTMNERQATTTEL